MKGLEGVDYRKCQVKLTWYEIEMARFVCELRISESKRLKLKNRYNETMAVPYDYGINFLGTKSELAVAKYLNMYFGGTVNTFHSLADVGLNIEVRASLNPKQSLIVRPKDSEEPFYFLALEISEGVFKIAGFTTGQRAKDEKYFMSPNSRPKAYFVPQSDLIKPTVSNLRRYGVKIR